MIGSEEHYETRETFPGGSKTSSLEVEYSDVPVYRPTIRYRWPPENGEVYVHRSSIEFEGDEMDVYGMGSRVTIWVLPEAPDHARLPGGFTHYLWAGIGFTAGLFALVLVSSVFFLHEGLFGGDLSRGISLFRSLSLSKTLVVLLVLTVGLQQLHQRVASWIGFKELVAVATGDILLLPPLLAAKGEPEPGQFLNDAENSFARLPWLARPLPARRWKGPSVWGTTPSSGAIWLRWLIRPQLSRSARNGCCRMPPSAARRNSSRRCWLRVFLPTRPPFGVMNPCAWLPAAITPGSWSCCLPPAPAPIIRSIRSFAVRSRGVQKTLFGCSWSALQWI